MDVYLIRTRNGRCVVFSSPAVIQMLESESGDRVRQFIDWLVQRKIRLIAWVGRVVRTGHDYYVRLEDRIDPVERVLKAMASANRFTVHSTEPDTNVNAEFQSVLKRQRRKHIAWFSLDIVFSAVVLAFTPFLAPIPGPNVFFYYPFLRLLSHYRAIKGATSGLRSSDVEFKYLPELRSLEDNLPGLTRFMERMDC